MAQGNFQDTRWTLVAKLNADPTQSNKALNELCSIYWNPLYVFARASGKNTQDAEDAVQGFLTRGVDKALFSMADKDRGKMRNFLLTAFKRFMKDEWVKQTAEKRGGGNVISLDFAEEESHFENKESSDPTQGFDKRWALMLVEQAKQNIEQQYAREGKESLFNAISGALSGELTQNYAEIANANSLSESAIKVGVHRLRKRFGEALRSEIRETVSSDDEVDEELRHLLTILAS